MDAHIAHCEEAWQWILKSYCLAEEHDSKDDDEEHYGHGCGYGYGFDKSVPIEEHDDVLKYGQDLEIKGIHDLDARRAKTVAIALETVPAFVANLTEEVEDRQQEINASVDAERANLEAALEARLAASVASLDATIAVLEA